MNWIEKNSHQVTLTIHHKEAIEQHVIQAIPTSIVREKVGEMEDKIRDLESHHGWLHVARLEQELAAAKAEVLQFAEWVHKNSYTILERENKWFKDFDENFFSTEQLYQQFKQGK